MDQTEVDEAIQRYYGGQFDESARLTTRSAQGALELARVQEIVTARLSPGSRVLDVGGATGVHAAALAGAGHAVTLVDPVESQVVEAAGHGTFTARVGDARDLDLDDDTVDAVLLLGPLYHLASAADRRRCLREAARVVAGGGWVFAAVIPRAARHAGLSVASDLPGPYPAAWIDLLEHGTPTPDSRFPAGHFHTPREIEAELVDAGLVDVELIAVEGPAGLVLESLPDDDPDLHAAALTLARRTAHLPGSWSLTPHLLAVGRVAALGRQAG